MAAQPPEALFPAVELGPYQEKLKAFEAFAPGGGLYGPHLLLPADDDYTVVCEGESLDGAVLTVTLGGKTVAEGPADEPLRFRGATSDGPLTLGFRAGAGRPVLRGFRFGVAP